MRGCKEESDAEEETATNVPVGKCSRGDVRKRNRRGRKGQKKKKVDEICKLQFGILPTARLHCRLRRALSVAAKRCWCRQERLGATRVSRDSRGSRGSRGGQLTRGLNEKETKSYNVDVARSLTRRQHLMFVFQRATWTFLWRGFVQAESCVAYAAKGKKKKLGERN